MNMEWQLLGKNHDVQTIVVTRSYAIRPGDTMTISGWGYDRKGREIRNGRFVTSGKKTKAKIVKLCVFAAK